MIQLSLNQKLSGVAVLIVTAFAAGRYSVPVVDIKKIEQVQTHDVKRENTLTKIHTVVITIPSGNTTTTTDLIVDTREVDNNQTVSKDTSSTTDARKTVNVALLGIYNLSQPKLDYGLSVSREVLGPVTAGIFGTKSGIVGVSVGLDF